MLLKEITFTEVQKIKTGKHIRQRFDSTKYVFLDIASEYYTGYFLIETCDKGMVHVPTSTIRSNSEEEVIIEKLEVMNRQFKAFFTDFMRPFENAKEHLKQIIEGERVIENLVSNNMSFADFLLKKSHLEEIEEKILTDMDLSRVAGGNTNLYLYPFSDDHIGFTITELSDCVLIVPIQYSDEDTFYVDMTAMKKVDESHFILLGNAIEFYNHQIEYVKNI